jgi:hypothetical protein
MMLYFNINFIHLQRRVSVRRQRYYYRGLKGTPYSLGLALPDGYGNLRVVAETEVKRLMADHNINGILDIIYDIVEKLF